AAAGGDSARIGLVGICLGGGYAVRAAAADPRIRAVAGIAGGYNSPAAMAASMGIGEYRAALGAALDRYDSYLPAVAARDGGGGAVRLLRHVPVPLAALAERGHPGIAALADDLRRARRGRAAGRHPA